MGLNKRLLWNVVYLVQAVVYFTLFKLKQKMRSFCNLVEFEKVSANQHGRRNLTFYKGIFTDPFPCQHLWSWMPSWWGMSCWSPRSRRQRRWGRRRCCNSCRAAPWGSWRLCPPVTEKVQNSELLVLTAKVGKPLGKFTWDTTVARRNPLMWVDLI